VEPERAPRQAGRVVAWRNKGDRRGAGKMLQTVPMRYSYDRACKRGFIVWRDGPLRHLPYVNIHGCAVASWHSRQATSLRQLGQRCLSFCVNDVSNVSRIIDGGLPVCLLGIGDRKWNGGMAG